MDITSQRLMLGATASGESCWRLSFPVNYTSLYSDGAHVGSDSAGNAYTSVQVKDGSNRGRINIVKVSPEGSVLFNRAKQHVGPNMDFISWLTVDPVSNRIYTREQEPDFGNGGNGILAYNSNLAVQQSVTHTLGILTGRPFVSPTGSLVSTSTNSSGSEFYLSLLSSTLGLLSQLQLTVSGYNFRTGRVAFLSDSRIIVSAPYSTTFSNYRNLVMCFNSGGTAIQWTVDQFGYGDGQYCDVVVDNADNVYTIVGDWSGSIIHIRKYNSSGVRQWARQISASRAYVTRAIWHDNRIIVVGATWQYSSSASTNYQLPFVLAMDGSGALLWNNYLGQWGQTAGISTNSVSKAGSNTFYIPIAASNSNSVYLFKLPTDGSLANGNFSGSTSPISYYVGTWTASNLASPSETTLSPTLFTPSYTLTSFTTNSWTNVSPTYTLTQA